MNISSTLAFLEFFDSIDVLLLIIVRNVGFFILLPIFSGSNIPNITKIALAITMSYIIFMTGMVSPVSYDPSTLSYFYLIVVEFLVGFILAFAVYLVFMAFFMAGQLIDYQIGFSMVSVLDPVTQIQVPITGNLLYLIALLMLVQTGGIHYIIGAYLHSFEILPIGGAVILSNATFLNVVIDAIVSFFVIGIRIALPIMGTILIMDIALGILVKAVPQMNVFVVGMPIKLFIGLAVFIIIVPIFSSVYDNIFSESYRNLINFRDGMSP